MSIFVPNKGLNNEGNKNKYRGKMKNRISLKLWMSKIYMMPKREKGSTWKNIYPFLQVVVMENPQDLKKQLVVEFDGEQANIIQNWSLSIMMSFMDNGRKSVFEFIRKGPGHFVLLKGSVNTHQTT